MSQFYLMPPGGAPAIPTSFVTDDGTAVPAANILNILGSPGVTTSGSGNTVIISLTNIATNYVSIIGPNTYDVSLDDYFISCGTFGGPVTVRLPNNPPLYQQFIVKDRSGTSNTNSVFITTVGGVVPIDGATTYQFADSYESVNLIFNGTSYETF